MKDFVLHKKISSFTAFVLTAVILLVFCSCEKASEPVQTEPESESANVQIPGGSFAAAYTSSDSLNPFFSASVVNSSLSSLLFRSLYYIGSDYKAVNDIAQGESLSGLKLNVSIKSGMVFSDETPLTARDIIYSFSCAKSSTIYSQRLKGISSCEQIDDYTVLFELAYADVNVLNALTFPIVKNSTASQGGDLPIGNGYYKFTQDGIRLSLTCNLFYDGDIPEVGTIRLSDVGDSKNLSRLVDTGEIDFCYSDLSDETAAKSYSAVTNVYLNNLVYIGVNAESVNLVLPELRQAISAAIDRQSIAESAFQRYARAAVLPFNTAWKDLLSAQTALGASASLDMDKANSILAKYGFSAENPLKLTLLCPDSNSFMRSAAVIIAEQLSKVNIVLETVYAGENEYKNSLSGGTYDLYFGEIKIPLTMDISEFFTPEGSVSYGIAFDNITCDEIYFSYRAGETSLEAFLTAFSSELPFIPICYRNGRFCYTRDIISPVEVSEDRIFSGISTWKVIDKQSER